MPDIFVRDVPKEIVAIIDGHAKHAQKSRQQYLHEHFSVAFSPTQSATAAIADRLRTVFQKLASVRFGQQEIQPTVASVAERLAHPSSLRLESTLMGEQPLEFSDADRLCELLGIHRQWLLNGERQPFIQSPGFREPSDLLRAVACDTVRSKSGNRYDRWYFVLRDDPRGECAVYAHDDARPYRFDLLLRDIPITDQVGNTGERLLFDFAMLCAATHGVLLRLEHRGANISSTGCVLDEQTFGDLLLGTIHPGHISQSPQAYNHWSYDLWDLEFTGSRSTKSFAAARQVYREHARRQGVLNNSDLQGYLARMVEEIQRLSQ